MKLRVRRDDVVREAPQNGNAAVVSSLRERLFARVDYRTRSFLLAGLLALLAFVVISTYVRQATGTPSAQGVPVFVALRDIPVGTPAAELVEGGLVAKREVARDSLATGVVETRAQIASQVVAERIYAGEQLSLRRFRPVTQLGIRGELNGTLRAIHVPGDRYQLLAGIIRAGDRVDVVATLKRPARGGGTEEAATRVILREIRVVRAPDAAAPTGTTPTTGGGASVVLMLTDGQARRLFHAMKVGQWSLLLRPGARGADGADIVDTTPRVLDTSIEP